MRSLALTGVVAALLLGGAAASNRAAGGPSAAVSAPAEPPAFSGSAERLDPATRRRMAGSSWRPGCPVGLGKLRLLEVSHWDLDGEVRTGRLVVHRAAAEDIVEVMRKLFRERFPIARMRLVDAYGANDRRSMAADNTSAFNCRFVAGKPGVWSEHAFGRAIDINPIENPYVSGSYVSPPAGRRFADRSKNAPGMVHRGDAVVRAFAKAGWKWGGKWPGTKDYQHFSATGD